MRVGVRVEVTVRLRIRVRVRLGSFNRKGTLNCSTDVIDMARYDPVWPI